MTTEPPKPTGTPPATATVLIKVDALRPNSKSVNMHVKVVTVGEPKEIPSKMGGEARVVTEAIVGDETGTVVMSLWGDQADGMTLGDILNVQNGFVSLVRGHMRLNVGRYGTKVKADSVIENVNTANDVSSKEYPMPERKRRFTASGYGSSYGGNWDDMSVSRHRYDRGGGRPRPGAGTGGGSQDRRRW